MMGLRCRRERLEAERENDGTLWFTRIPLRFYIMIMAVVGWGIIVYAAWLVSQ